MLAIKLIFIFGLIFSIATLATAIDPNVMLNLVNDERKKVGASPVTLNDKLASAAQKHTDFMVKTDTLTHDDASGSLGDRVKASGYDFSNVGENIAQGFNDEKSVMEGWMNSSGHRANILNKAFTNLGVGFGTGKSGKYWTQVFGRPLNTRKIKRSFRKRLAKEE